MDDKAREISELEAIRGQASSCLNGQVREVLQYLRDGGDENLAVATFVTTSVHEAGPVAVAAVLAEAIIRLVRAEMGPADGH